MGLFDRMLGRDKPWGTVDDAFRLLQEKKIDDGRELLRRLIKHAPDDLEALALGVFELQRPPEEKEEGYRRIMELTRKAPADANALWVVGTFTSPGDETSRRWGEILDQATVTTHGAAFRVLSFVCMSDSQFQLRCRPGFALTSMYATNLVRGAAKFLLRDHAGALECFEAGEREADRVPAFYEEKLQVRLLPEDREEIARVARILSRMGTAVTERDRGRIAQAKAGFRALAEESPILREDLNVLAR